MRSTFPCVVFSVILLGAAANATDYHVDAIHGDDSTGNGSASAPWRTITRAHAATLVAGDRVWVAPGNYDSALGEVFPITLAPAVPVIGAGMDRTFVRGVAGVTSTLFRPGGGQTWYRLTDLSLSRAAIAVSQLGPGGADTFLLLERLAIENNDVGVKLSDGPGIYTQCALLQCHLRNNDIGVWLDEAWFGFGGVFGFVYGSTLRDNQTALLGTTSFGNPPALLLQHSIVKKNDDDSFVSDFSLLAPVLGCLVSEPSLIGQNGNSGGAPAFLTPLGIDPHLRQDSHARDLVTAGTTHWPPAPAPGVPAASWWGVAFDPTFESVPDGDGRPRTDGFVDAGCDEVEVPAFFVAGDPGLGSPVELLALASPHDALALYASLGGGAAIPTPYGLWSLEFPFAFLTTLPVDANGHFVVTTAIPTDPLLVGHEVYLQGHTVQPPIELTPIEWLRILP
jgi:hypothetical protein